MTCTISKERKESYAYVNWRSVGDDYPEEFTQAQKDYWETHAYADLLSNLKSAVPAFDLNNYSVALRNVFWSRSVHHGTSVFPNRRRGFCPACCTRRRWPE